MIKTIKAKIASLEAQDKQLTLEIHDWIHNANMPNRPHIMMRTQQYVRGQLDAYNDALDALGL